MSQTDYNQQAAAFAGMLADAAMHDIRSRANGESVEVPFGVAVKEGATEGEFEVPTAADDNIVGITVHSHAIDNRGIDTDEDIPAERMASILRWGYVYAVPEEDIVKGDDVYFRIADGAGGTQKGALRNDDDSGTAVRLPGATWDQSGSEGDPLRVEVKGKPGESSVESKSLDHAQATADTTQYFWENHSGRAFLIEEVTYYNATGLAEDAANYFDIQVKSGATVFANWSTETGQEGTIAADTPVRMTLGADLVVPPDARVDLFLDETGTATLPAGTAQVTGRYL